MLCTLTSKIYWASAYNWFLLSCIYYSLLYYICPYLLTIMIMNELEIILGGEVFLRARPTFTWMVTFIEGDKLYCMRTGTDSNVYSIVVDRSLVLACDPPKQGVRR